MARQIESNPNFVLGDVLQGMMSRSRVIAENTQTIVGSPGKHPDILITSPGRSPVVVEAEFMPACTVEEDANKHLGESTTIDGRVIEATIALRYPASLRKSHDLKADLKEAQLTYCIFTEESKDAVTRFPESGWLEGSVEDVADMVRLTSVPQRAVNDAADTLEKGIERAAKHLDQLDKTRPGITGSIAKTLGMRNVPQTRRMACAIIANALVFHERFAGMHEGVKPLRQVCGIDVSNPVDRTLEAWEEILKINYWSIFAIAKDILGQMDAREGASVLWGLRDTALSVNATGVDNAHDLTGRIFQRLIVDRKYLATFYTLPASAALLARLAVSKMQGVDWGDLEAIRKLRVADFACGTGALLSAVYEQIAARHERAGGDPEALHKVMLEQVLYGCDVMPSAVHITASTLAGMEPSVDFKNSRIHSLTYGRQPDGGVKIGSLELLQSQALELPFNTSNPAMRTGRSGEETSAYTIGEFPDEYYDLIIMNPPFTNATNHEGAHADITNPAFAAFGATPDDQKEMGKRANRLAAKTCSHGNAGIASTFAALGHKKLKPGGILALVLPLSVANGLAWQKFRNMIGREYTDVMILSIAANGRDMAFSSDTGMADCLIIARRVRRRESPDRSNHFVSFGRRPKGFVYARHIASTLLEEESVRRISDGPYGGTSLPIGKELVGESIAAPVNAERSTWGAVRLADYSLAQTAFALSRHSLWMPGKSTGHALRTALLGAIGELGFVHRDIIGPIPRGPFDKIQASPTATYPSLWNHNALNENHIVCAPDSQLIVSPNPPK